MPGFRGGRDAGGVARVREGPVGPAPGPDAGLTSGPGPSGPQPRTARKQAVHWQTQAATVQRWKISWNPNQCGEGSGR